MNRYWIQMLESGYHIQRGVGTVHVSGPKTYPETRLEYERGSKKSEDTHVSKIRSVFIQPEGLVVRLTPQPNFIVLLVF